MTVLGISCFYHDAAAAIIRDGRLVTAVAEERLSRRKHDNRFPKLAIQHCLNWLNLNVSDISCIAFYEKPILKFERVLFQHLEHFPRSRHIFNEYIPQWFGPKFNIAKFLEKEIGFKGTVQYFPHHLSHAASAYYYSGFRNAAIVTLDGVGEWSTTTIGTGKGNAVTIDREIRFPHSLGLLYSTLTSFLGFHVNDAEYKVMGLAAYGDPAPFRHHLDQLITQYPDGSFALNMKYFDYSWSNHMPSPAMSELFGVPPREPESRMTPVYENIAAALQEKLESVVMNLLQQVYATYRIPNLCLAGGVALNSVMNGKILSRTPFRQVYIPPDPGDAGGAIGAALLAYTQSTGKSPVPAFTPYLGPDYSAGNIVDTLEAYALPYTHFADTDALLDTVAGYLAKQKIIGWFQGRMEWGPRALGSRSILASAAKPEMKDIINSKVKHRELFRPFAPAILAEYVSKYFKADTALSKSADYMLMVYPFTAKGERDVPATVHVDRTGRLQVVHRNDNPRYYDLIERYRNITGIPVIINTSFNVRGEPIVCTPKDAVECFLHTDIDYLVIGDYLVSKRRVTNKA